MYDLYNVYTYKHLLQIVIQVRIENVRGVFLRHSVVYVFNCSHIQHACVLSFTVCMLQIDV